MTDPLISGNDYDLHRLLSTVDDVTPISSFISNSGSSPINPLSSTFCHPHDRIIHQVSGSDGLCVDTVYPKMTPESKWITTKFTLPEDWFVEKKYRKSGGAFDKYYHDPESGRKFRSLKDVERYLTEGIVPTSSKRLKYHKKHLQKYSNLKEIIYGGKMQLLEEDKDNQYQLINVTPSSCLSTSPFTLPDGWIVEKVPRKTGDRRDRYFYEPGTGHKFRSLLSVQKHLAELEENSPLSVVLEGLRENNLPLSKAFRSANPIKNYGSCDSRKKSISKKEQDSAFSNAAPNKINWVIPCTAGETWNAFVGDKLVPEFMKQQWGKRFMLAINNTEHNRNESAAAFAIS
ncbi:hypothetical protein R6Q57_004700 [Mikania cordata]